MNIEINKFGIEYNEETVNELRTLGEDALDYMWKQSLIKKGLSPVDESTIRTIKAHGDRLKNQGKVCVIVASKVEGLLVKGILSALPTEKIVNEVVIIGENLSTRVYEELIVKLKKTDFTVIGIAMSEEEVQVKAAFAILKKLLISKYGPEKAQTKITLVGNKQSSFFSGQAQLDDLPFLLCPDEIEKENIDFTPAVLLPLYVAGVDIEAFMRGYYDLVSSPRWDFDAKDYGLIKAKCIKERFYKENILFYQKEFDCLTSYFEELMAEQNTYIKKYNMPIISNEKLKNSFITMLSVKTPESDIMMPNFEGTSEEGTLSSLLKEQEDSLCDYLENSNVPGFKIEIEVCDEYNLGQLIYFMEISNGITLHLMKNWGLL